MQTAFLVELFPFHVRARGITIFQWWNRGGAFFNQLVNPIGIDAAGMSICSVHLKCCTDKVRKGGNGTSCELPAVDANGQVLKDISYCVWNAFQVVFVYFMFPETSGRTLEELTFSKCASSLGVSVFSWIPQQCMMVIRRQSRMMGPKYCVHTRKLRRMVPWRRILDGQFVSNRDDSVVCLSVSISVR